VFGFVKPFIPSLRVGEYEFYKSVYCGLCRSMKKHTGGISRATLSYDMTFFALVRLALSGEDYLIKKSRCALHPMRKRPVMCDNAALEYSAYVSALLVWYKLHDTLSDERGIKRIGAMTVLPCAAGMKRNSARAGETIAKIIADAMTELAALEEARCPTPDLAADVFGKMLGELLSYGFEKNEAMIAYEIGLHTGRWVYLADAVCDYEDDRKSGSYNPFFYAFSNEAQMKDFKKNFLHGMMSLETEAIMRAMDLVEFGDRVPLRNCIYNIVCDGMESALSMAVGKEETHGE